MSYTGIQVIFIFPAEERRWPQMMKNSLQLRSAIFCIICEKKTPYKNKKAGSIFRLFQYVES